MKTNRFLNRKIRLSLMISLIVSFFVISPLVILYTMGYRYDIRSGIIRETGVLSIDVEPEEVYALLNNKAIIDGMPMRVTDLAPGTYHISLSLGGFHTWEKDILIEKIQTTYIKDVTLFKKSNPIPFFQSDNNKKEILFSFDGQYMLAQSTKEDGYTLSLFELRNSGDQGVQISTSTEPVTVEWSPYNHVALFRSGDGVSTTLSIFSATDIMHGRTSTIGNTTGIKKLQWSPKAGSRSAFIQEGDILYRLDQAIITELGPVSSTSWYVDSSEQVWTLSKDGKSITSNTGVTLFAGSNQIEELLFEKDNIWIAKKRSQTLVFKKDGQNLRLLSSLPTERIRYNPNTKEWISWSPWEIWNIYENGEVALLNRTSNEINDVWPMDKHGVLMISRNNSISGFNPGYFLSHTLLENAEVDYTGTDIESRTVYFYGTIEGRSGLFSLDY
ncbi:MAG: PEGA domain-containing protein [Candidatus Magasanikbacteria bacterium]